MITHVIYHIPGRKVGCTKNIKSRSQEYFRTEGSVPEIVILEELHDKTDQQAGDIEWQWADRFGYRRGQHYTITRRTPEQRQEIARKGGQRAAKVMTIEQKREIGRRAGTKAYKLGAGFHSFSHDQRVEVGRRAGLRSAQVMSIEQKREIGRKVGLTLGQKAGFIQRSTCPHCGKEANLASLHQWHFDRCKLRPMVRRS